MITMSISCSSPQAIGYFVSSETNSRDPPVLCVISKEEMEVIIFPFFVDSSTQDKDLAINAVSIPFKFDDDQFFSSEVCLLVLLSHGKRINLLFRIRVLVNQSQSGLICRDENEIYIRQLVGKDAALAKICGKRGSISA